MVTLYLSNMADIASYFRNIGQYTASKKVELKINEVKTKYMIDTRYKVRNRDTENLKIDNPTFQRINDLKYLRNFVTENSEIRSETKTGIIAGNMWCSRSQWPRGLRRRSTAARLLGLWVRIPPGAWMSVVSVVCCQVQVSATHWSRFQRSPTGCDASLCVI